MSVIATYLRLDSVSLDSLRSDQNWRGAAYGRSIPNAELVDIDKACEGLVWLLSQLPFAPTVAVGESFEIRRSFAPRLRGEGGTKEPRLKAGYGPASSLSAEQVIELSAWLAPITPAQLRPLYDPNEMEKEDVYPSDIWTEEGTQALDDYLIPSLQMLQAFFARAATARQQVLVFFE